MPLPLAIAAPAALGAAAYLAAKADLHYDLKMLSTVIISAYRMQSRLRKDQLNLFYVFEDAAKNPAKANKTFLWFEGRTWTYAEAYESMLRYAGWLKNTHNVQAKDVVAINFQNGENFVFLWWALWSLGARPAFINYNLTGRPLSHSVSSADTKLCVVDAEMAGNITEEVKSAVPKTNFVIFNSDVASKAQTSPPFRAKNADRSEDEITNMALLIYTSGTTGLPKPAIITWGKLVGGGTFADQLLDRGSDVFYTSMPLYHSAGSMLGLVPTVLSGSTIALGKRFSTKAFWADVRASKATGIQYVGETLRYLLAAPPQRDPTTGADLDKLHNVKLAFGNGLRPDIWNRFKTRFGIETIVEFYAATEATLATFNVSRNDLSLGAIGRTGALMELLFRNSAHVVQLDWETDTPVRDPKTGFCIKVPKGELGELLFTIPADQLEKRFRGYYNNPKATKAKVLRDVFTKGDAWFRTGDVVRSENGMTYFSDRIGDTFRWKSENVATSEVSEAVGRHSAVREANVYGVELPHHDGRAGCVTINLDGGATPTTLSSLAEHSRKNLPKYAVPLFLRVVTEELGQGSQMTGTNKQQKHNLRKAGVKPGAIDDGAEVFWLKGDTYVPFGEKEWKQLEAGQVKL